MWFFSIPCLVYCNQVHVETNCVVLWRWLNDGIAELALESRCLCPRSFKASCLTVDCDQRSTICGARFGLKRLLFFTRSLEDEVTTWPHAVSLTRTRTRSHAKLTVNSQLPYSKRIFENRQRLRFKKTFRGLHEEILLGRRDSVEIPVHPNLHPLHQCGTILY